MHFVDNHPNLSKCNILLSKIMSFYCALSLNVKFHRFHVYLPLVKVKKQGNYSRQTNRGTADQTALKSGSREFIESN